MEEIIPSPYYRDPVVWAILERPMVARHTAAIKELSDSEILDKRTRRPIDDVAIFELKKLALNTSGATRQRLEALAAHREFPIGVRWYAKRTHRPKRPKSSVQASIMAMANEDVQVMLIKGQKSDRNPGKSSGGSQNGNRGQDRIRVPPTLNFTGELAVSGNYVEGAVTQVIVNRYERDLKARAACLQAYGYTCNVCKFEFERHYGEIGKRFIHVHHREPIALRKKSYQLDTTTDLAPVCPNCHAMLHTSNPRLDVEELREIWEGLH